jgi:uncharacterized protein GlcG (DUF336 family)
MSRQYFESLEKRQFLSAAGSGVVETASREPRSAAETHVGVQDPTAHANLTAAEVTTILGQAASQARPGQLIVVMDDEGVVLGIVGMTGYNDNVAPDGTPYPATSGILSESEQLIRAASARARTAAFFQSNQNAFTPRTARFIIQDHFPQPRKNTPGGPLYGVQFSSFRGSDVLRDEQSGFPALSGDPGGIPIYKGGIKVGGIGVAGDGKDVSARPELLPIALPGHNPNNRVWQGKEESDFDEAVALAGVKGFETPKRIRATEVFVDGLRFPFVKNRPAKAQDTRALSAITTANQAALISSTFLRKPDAAVRASTPPTFVRATFAGITGDLKRQFEVDATGNKVAVPQTLAAQIVDSNDSATVGGALLPEAQRLTEADVNQILENAVATAVNTRALILEPDGVAARVHMSVVDRDGDVLGVFRMDDGPNFGYEVAIQKARTAAFFSDDTHAITTRALGFVSQKFFPIGIEKNSSVGGPFFEVQDRLFLTGIAQGTEPSSVNFRPMVGPGNTVRNPLRNGITIFPGGIPLYKDGVFVGAIGISGDGVDQDERIGYGGSVGFRPADNDFIRSDQLSDAELTDHLTDKVQRLVDLYDLSVDAGVLNTVLGPGALDPIDQTGEEQLPARFRERMNKGFHDFRLPYLRFPRNPERF